MSEAASCGFNAIPKDEQRLAKRRQTAALRAKKPVPLTNEKFHELTPAKKRIAIAKDVIAWLKSGKARAEKGTYLRVFGPDREIHNAPVVNGFTCKVCALGGLFATAAERGCFKLTDDDAGARGGQSMQAKLEPFFDKTQLALIECAFERSRHFYSKFAADGTEIVSPEKERAEWFGVAIVDSCTSCSNSERDGRVLRAIMQNIIDNGGEFIP